MAKHRYTVRQLQRDLNNFVRVTHLRGMGPVLVDGKMGMHTHNRVKTVKFYLGYSRKNINDHVDATFVWRLRHPRSRRNHGRWENIRVRRARTRRIKQRKAAHIGWKHVTGFDKFDGLWVAGWMVPWLEKSRTHGWRGRVVSGVRTPAHSEHLCFVMCGRPSCPGRCAGRSSNHNMLLTQGFPHGAVDVSDFIRFGQIQHQIGSPLINKLGAQDPVHFSSSGR